jgi:hypothetical protein
MRKRIPVKYYSEVKLTGDLLHIVGVLTVMNNTVYVVQEWK